MIYLVVFIDKSIHLLQLLFIGYQHFHLLTHFIGDYTLNPSFKPPISIYFLSIRKAKAKGSYWAAHEREIILHEAAAKALKAAGVSKLPDVFALQKEYAKLQEQKEAL